MGNNMKNEIAGKSAERPERSEAEIAGESAERPERSEAAIAGVVGCGVIGAAWASRMLLNGVDVAISDPNPEAETILTEVLANAVVAYDDLGLPTDRQGTYRFAESVADAVADAEFIQESVPERPDLKLSLIHI